MYYSAQRIDDTLVQEVTPGRHSQGRAGHVVRPRLGLFEGWDNAANKVLDHESKDAGAGVDRCQDEKSFEQDREMVPDSHQSTTAKKIRKDRRHAHSQSRRSTCTRKHAVFADIVSNLRDNVRRDRKAPP